MVSADAHREITETGYASGCAFFIGTRLLSRLGLFDETYPYDFPEPESLAIARAAGLTVVEVPVQMRERQGGRSSIAGFSTIYYMFKVTIAVVLTYMRTRGRKPRED